MFKLIMTVASSACLRRQVGQALGPYGYRMVEAVDGEDALRQLASHRVDMIFTDLELPDLDGIGLIRRAHAHYRRMPVVVMGAGSGDTRWAEAEAAGAAGWVAKPLNPEQLVSFARKELG